MAYDDERQGFRVQHQSSAPQSFPAASTVSDRPIQPYLEWRAGAVNSRKWKTHASAADHAREGVTPTLPEAAEVVLSAAAMPPAMMPVRPPAPEPRSPERAPGAPALTGPIDTTGSSPWAPARAAANPLFRPRRSATLVDVAPPREVPGPMGRQVWSTEPNASNERLFGSHSHAGPEEVEDDKGNQDFAFHVEIPAPVGAPWIAVGVADGVSMATWSARASRHAAASFIEALLESFRSVDFPFTEDLLLLEAWSRPVARAFHGRLLRRLDEDRHYLLRERHMDPTWAPDVFKEKFWAGPGAFEVTTKEWFQTTLLAVALGPRGGFGLFLGDGYSRIDRYFADGRSEKSAGAEASGMISFAITESQVHGGLVRLSPNGAARMGVLLATDGVAKSPEPAVASALARASSAGVPAGSSPLDTASFTSSAACRAFLEALARDPTADRDNMSVAFAVRSLELPSRGAT